MVSILYAIDKSLLQRKSVSESSLCYSIAIVTFELWIAISGLFYYQLYNSLSFDEHIHFDY